MSHLVRLIAVLAAGFASGAHGAPLTVVGFNVESDGSSDIVIGRQLERSSDVDLWALTEIYREGGWVEKMRAAAGVGEGVDFGAVVGATGQGNESLILYRSDRLALLASEEISAAAGGRRGPAPLAARFLLDGRREFLFVVVRLSDWGPTRLDQTRALADWAARQTLPVIAAGTFAFGVREGGTAGDEAMTLLQANTDWQWVRPADAPATACGQQRLVQDFVFAGGPARDWRGEAQVTFRQSNYCKDDDSDRTSGFRPVIAGFSTEGSADGIAGTMPERQIGPFLPATAVQGEIREAREEVAKPALVNEAAPSPSLVTEAGAPAPPGPAPLAPAPVAPRIVPPPAPTPPARPAEPVTAAPAAAATPGAAEDAGSQPGPDPGREALMKRLEALEREAQAIREALEAGE